eukprot:scaffold2177_cov272-Pinguiococcus_pyrenoidosus.AAC.14
MVYMPTMTKLAPMRPTRKTSIVSSVSAKVYRKLPGTSSKLIFDGLSGSPLLTLGNWWSG